MTIFDLRCDRCGMVLLGPAESPEATGLYGFRFLYHPGDEALRDNSGMFCAGCWAATAAWLGEGGAGGRCAVCGAAVEDTRSLHLRGADDSPGWQLCKAHAVEFLNGLRTVEPKLDRDTFTLAGDWRRTARRPDASPSLFPEATDS